MKFTIGLLLIFYALYVRYLNNSNYKFSITLLKQLIKEKCTRNQFWRCLHRRKNCDNKKDTERAFLFWVLILSGDIEINPGPEYTCPRCNQRFARPGRLKNHLEKSDSCDIETVFTCTRCNKRFDRAARLKTHLVKCDSCY